MTVRTRIATAVATLALATGVFAAAPRITERHHARMHRIEWVANELQLTDAQKEFARTLFRENRGAAQPIIEQLRQNHAQMVAAVKANNDAEITRVANAQSQLTAQLHALLAKGLAKFYAQLTPDQKAKADAMYDNLRSHFEHRGFMHRG
ncbi:MAG TPA: Spy/CpxP family protein refolding chaperone [Bryobacteraceae bacterium]|nr:Spy/CpxP family protein refolding chaperone [Bryobacteraceae bacterium]